MKRWKRGKENLNVLQSHANKVYYEGMVGVD